MKTFRLVFFWVCVLVSACLLSSCGFNREKRVEIPRDEVPHFQYQKLGDNWFKLPTGSKFPISPKHTTYYSSRYKMSQGVPDQPREEALRAKVTKHEYTKFDFSPSVDGSIRRNFPDIYKTKGDGVRIDFDRLELKVDPGKLNHLCRLQDFADGEKGRWVEFSKDFVIIEKYAGRKGGCLRSKQPAYFGQYLFLRGAYIGPNYSREFNVRYAQTHSGPNGTGRNESQHPYLSAILAIYPKKGLDENASFLLTAQYFQDIIEKIYVGPNLPPDIQKERD